MHGEQRFDSWKLVKFGTAIWNDYDAVSRSRKPTWA